MQCVYMKFLVISGCCAAICAASCLGQTNTCMPVTPRFFLPPVQLRLEPQPETLKVAPVASVTLTSPAAPAACFALNSTDDDGGFHSKVIRSGEFYLTRAEPRPEGGMARVLDGIFTPEVVHVGKIPVTGSIVTAIKRKNPLCLLNPVVFQVSW